MRRRSLIALGTAAGLALGATTAFAFEPPLPGWLEDVRDQGGPPAFVESVKEEGGPPGWVGTGVAGEDGEIDEVIVIAQVRSPGAGSANVPGWVEDVRSDGGPPAWVEDVKEDGGPPAWVETQRGASAPAKPVTPRR